MKDHQRQSLNESKRHMGRIHGVTRNSQLATRYSSPVAGLDEAGIVRDHRSPTRNSLLTTRNFSAITDRGYRGIRQRLRLMLRATLCCADSISLRFREDWL